MLKLKLLFHCDDAVKNSLLEYHLFVSLFSQANTTRIFLFSF